MKRRQFFEKANVAYNRGWGAVAQYYSECVSAETKFSSKKSAINIIYYNNFPLLGSRANGEYQRFQQHGVYTNIFSKQSRLEKLRDY